ncbi:Nramp family divalent metal transporter [Paradesertivirga mongoliensis]|uniref:Nramp family divalent metal transporter n=1 Tax=Paradesertivirga mongoliensis TaxID=2100740 RepID=A0ABW4ZLP6_9SPHI|nr:Nramp family divalent metal transporter [Pedobacter mongoliensis]
MEQDKIIKAPRGRERLKWLGPAFIWMLSAAGSGELLFTPRIASQYGYTLVWALVIAVVMKWFINREIGRYTVCSGATFFKGLESISSKSRALLWFLIIPQLAVAVATVAGLAGGASTALITLLDIPPIFYVILIVLITTSIISMDRYKLIEKATTVFAIIISLAVLTASISTGPDAGAIASGFVPQIPSGLKVDELLSWLGFMLAGAAGMMWFSYWIAARGYGAANLKNEEPLNFNTLSPEQTQYLKGWIKQMTIANTLAVVGALVIAFAFLILGTELLKPQGLLPEENKVAETLGRLLGGIWGELGFWFMILAVFITFFSTILSDQDGFGRMFSDGVRILFKNTSHANSTWLQQKKLQKTIVITVLGIIPVIVYLLTGEPVILLKIAGVIEACHIPVVAGFILYLNYKKLPVGLKPTAFSLISTAIAGLTFTAFAVVYILQLSGLIKI